MDTRLELTDKQKKLVEQLKQLFEVFEKENVGYILDHNEYGAIEGFKFYNKTEVLDVDYYNTMYNDIEEEYIIDDDSEDDVDDYIEDVDEDAIIDFVDEESGEIFSIPLREYNQKHPRKIIEKDKRDPVVWYTPSKYDLPSLEFEDIQPADSDIWFSVCLKKDDKELDAFYKRREEYKKQLEREKELAPLNAVMGELSDKLKRVEEAVTDGDDYIHRLEKGGLSQEIIEEAKEKIESSKVEYDKLQKEIKSLNDEIEKVKAKYEG